MENIPSLTGRPQLCCVLYKHFHPYGDEIQGHWNSYHQGVRTGHPTSKEKPINHYRFPCFF